MDNLNFSGHVRRNDIGIQISNILLLLSNSLSQDFFIYSMEHEETTSDIGYENNLVSQNMQMY
jgi:hypothetical protein